MKEFENEMVELLKKHKVSCVFAATNEDKTLVTSAVHGQLSIVDINTLNNSCLETSCLAIEEMTGKVKNPTLKRRLWDMICNK